MKNLLIAAALATLTIAASVSTASAVTTGGAGNGRGGSSTHGGNGEGGRCINVAGAPTNCGQPKKVALGEGCGCTVKKVRIGGRISYIQDCYFFDVKANLERYCQPWERTSN